MDFCFCCAEIIYHLLNIAVTLETNVIAIYAEERVGVHQALLKSLKTVKHDRKYAYTSIPLDNFGDSS